MNATHRTSTLILLATFLTTSCQAPLATGPAVSPAAPHMVLNATAAVEAMATKPNSNWQDAGVTYEPLMARRAAGQYRVAAAGLATSLWDVTLPARSSSAPAYRHKNLSYHGPDPAQGEVVYVAAETTTGTPQIYRITASNAQILDQWDVLSGLTAPGTFQETAVLLSGDNRRLYLLTSGGYFLMLDAETGERLFARKLSASGFARTRPYIDYANGGGWPNIGANEDVYAVSNDGSLFRVNVLNGTPTVASWPAAGGQDAALWPGAAAIAYEGAESVQAAPVVWRGQAFFGTMNGDFHRVDVQSGSPSLTTWRPGALTSARHRAITAPPAIEFEGNMVVSHVFVACGDRLAWIDPKLAAGDAVVVSPPLVLDNASKTHGRLSDFTYASTVTQGPYDSIDYASISSQANPAPTRWGDGTGDDAYLYGAEGYTSATDGNISHGYMQFIIPQDDFAGATPVKGRIDLSSVKSPATKEVIDLSLASNFQKASDYPWSGLNYWPDIDWHNRPDLLSWPTRVDLGTISAADRDSGMPRYSLNFADPMPADQPNIQYGSEAWWTYAMTSVGKKRGGTGTNNATQWYPVEPGDDNAEPKLFMTLTTTKTPIDRGLRSQPSINAWTRRVAVMGSNAIFELPFDDKRNFQRKSDIRFNMTASGRGTDGAGGPVRAGEYVLPKTNVLFTGARLVVADYDPAGDRFFLNQFKAGLDPASDVLEYQHDAGPGSGEIGEAMLFDYASGSAYATTRDNRLVRIDIL